MLQPKPKSDYLANLQARNCHNREVVATIFVPLDEAQRSWQPDPNEWSIDQCFEHLVVTFDVLSPNFIPALNKSESPQADEISRHTGLASRTMEKQFDPNVKMKTLKAHSPTAVYIPEILTRWLAQQARLETMITQAAESDLQTLCRIKKWLPLRYNLGDYLNFFVSHDELHIDQAERALAACGQAVLA